MHETRHRTTGEAGSTRATRILAERESIAARRPGRGAAVVTHVSESSRLDWDAYVKCHHDGTFFHSRAWGDAVAASFPHERHDLCTTVDGRFTGVLPLFSVRCLGGKRLISVPYGVGGGILADDVNSASALYDTARNIARSAGCKAIELRSERAQLPMVPIFNGYVSFRRELPDAADGVLDWLPRKARAAARNGREKFRLRAEFGDEHLPEVWRLYALSMRRLGSINYPLRFFEALVAGTPQAHWTTIIRWNGEAVAGLVTFLFKDRVMPYFVGATESAKHCSAANFLYLSIMERAAACGFRVFDFGRSRKNNSGSFDFKRFHGFEPNRLEYQVESMSSATSPIMTPDDARIRVARALWRRLPLWVTRRVGARLANYIPG